MANDGTSQDQGEDLAGDFGEKTDFDHSNDLKAAVSHAAESLGDASVDDSTMDWDTYEKASKGGGKGPDLNPLYEAALAVEDPANVMPPKKDSGSKPAGTGAGAAKPGASGASKPAAPAGPAKTASGPTKPGASSGSTPAVGAKKSNSDESLHSKVVPVSAPSGPSVTRSGIQTQPVKVIPNPTPPASPKTGATSVPPKAAPPPPASTGSSKSKTQPPTPTTLPPSEPAPPTPAPNLVKSGGSNPLLVGGLTIVVLGLIYVIALTFGLIPGGHDVEGVPSNTPSSVSIKKRFGGDDNPGLPGTSTTATSTNSGKPEVIDMQFKAPDVTIKFTANVPQFEVKIDGVVQDGPLVVPRSPKQTYQAHVEAKGFIPANYVIPADEDRTIHFELERIR